MVKLTKIYTRTGDEGRTGLGDGARVPKTDPRVGAYGTVDEANAALGVAVVEGEREGTPRGSEIAGVLRQIQHDMFDVGADLATPVVADEPADQRLRVQASQTERLEAAIDHYNAPLGELTSFALPGGSGLAAALHVARTVVRRAERDAVSLLLDEGDRVGGESVRYLNRLSDLLFVLARAANADGSGDVLWLPGKGRSERLV